jgi:N-methylhydantoinase A/oxoprolinase/acetone carboxylase beta subunit
MRIGIDVGGTHTDAVLMDGDKVLASTKALTSADVISGIKNAFATILDGVPTGKIETVMIGTTQFTNAVVERRELTPVAAIRIGLPSGRGLPPFSDWPDDIRSEIGGHAYMVKGGYLYDGWPVADIDLDEIDNVIKDIKSKGIKNIAIASAFSPMNAEPEDLIASKIREAIPDADITLSNTIGRLGILERENAAILNASLLPFARRVVSSFIGALKAYGLACPLYVSQNDGTLMSTDFVRRFPALTFASGPTNSLRGASRLTGLKNAIVVDIGGTTSDIGVLQDGFPRESNVVIKVGGIRTNFRMPDILALGLGGGSIIGDSGLTIGPKSVGHNLVNEGLVFGGNTLTASDIAVALGHTKMGDPTKVSHLNQEMLLSAKSTMQTMLEQNIDMMRPGGGQIPVILVGGGAGLIGKDMLAGLDIHRPENAGVANAIGAAIAQIGGESERLLSYQDMSRDAAVELVANDARERAVAAGADSASLRVADIEETSVPYMNEGATRVRVKVIGDIASLSKGDDHD